MARIRTSTKKTLMKESMKKDRLPSQKVRIKYAIMLGVSVLVNICLIYLLYVKTTI